MNPWVHTLKSICHDYDDLVYQLETGPVITYNLKKNHSRSWIITFDIDWGINPLDPEGTIEYLDDSMLTQRIDWITEELKRWDNVRRTSYNMWSFKKKYDADKFITLYNLIWAR